MKDNNIFYKLLRPLLYFYFLFTTSTVKGMDHFSIPTGKGYRVENIKIGQIFVSDYKFKISDNNQPINGLGVNGRIIKSDDDYIVRILMKDKNGKSYLVMECYDELNDSSTFVMENYSEETALLPNTTPDSFFVFVHHAVLKLDGIVYSITDDKSGLDSSDNVTKIKELRQEQAKVKAANINRYNRKHKKLWFAGLTDICIADFETRRRQLGFSANQNTGGLEYYIGGIFEMGSHVQRNPPPNSPYISHFDWRDRHGKNWMTSVKNQGNSQYCAAFSSVGALEGLTNLFFNRLLDLDLSEQEAARCNEYQAPSVFYTGMELHYPIDYIVEHGVCDEISYPFYNANTPDCIRDQITPIYTVQPSGQRSIFFDDDTIKFELINSGPLISGYYFDVGGDSIPDRIHAMTLVGYGTIQAGDKYSVIDNGVLLESDSIDVRDERVGLTYWIFKDSYYGLYEWEHDGYMYLIFNNPQWMVPPYAYELPISTEGVSNAQVLWTDDDGDGYFFWGLGSKPSSCPYWIPNTPDGDDSDPLKGPLDNYGYTASIGAITTTLTVTDSINYTINHGLNSNVVVANGGVLSITSEVVMANCRIHVENGGTLIIDGGRLLHADIELKPSSRLVVRNGGLIHMKPGFEFFAPKGAIVDLEYGEIS